MRFIVMRVTKTAVFVTFATFTYPMMAQTPIEYSSNWYVGGDIGLSTTHIYKEQVTLGLSDFTYTDSNRTLGSKLYAGYKFNDYFSIEGGYFNLGSFSLALSIPTGTLAGTINIMGLDLDLVATLPLASKVSLFARLGLNYAQTKDTFITTGSISLKDVDPEYFDLNYKFGVGIAYEITDSIGIRLEVERYRIDDAIGNYLDVDQYVIGLTYRFGAPEGEEEEVVVVVTELKAEAKIIESVTKKKKVLIVFEDIHFDYDESSLNKEAKDALKRDLIQLKEAPQIRMHITGHASGMGTEKYNQELSERRAQAVKDYLIKETLIPEDKITINGYGEKRPSMYENAPCDSDSKAAKANMRAYIKVLYE